MIETHLWYFNICNKTITNNKKSKHFNSKTHEHKEKYGIVVKEIEIFQPEIDELCYILDNIFKDCRDEFFHTFEYKFVYDIKFTNLTNNEEVNLTITH